jgi:hypothetical protein
MTDANEGDSTLRAIPGIVRIAASAWLRTAGWAAETSARTSSRVMQAAVSGESPAQFLTNAGSDVRRYVRTVLGIQDDAPADGGEPATEAEPSADGATGADASLQELGAELLRRSADVEFADDIHPAYARILGELAPDEGRILRFLAIEGPQPAVDVRTGRPLNVGSELVAPGLTMIGAGAGARHPDRVPAYLNNLNRLGLIWFSREPLTNPLRYQVLEVQPDVLAAMKSAGRGKTIRRSIHLTPFGDDFCVTCLPIHTAELDALPGDEGPAVEGPHLG